MKKLLFASLLTAAVVFAQGTSGSPGKVSETPKTESGKKHSHTKSGKKAHKGKKGSSTTTTTPPPK